MADQTSTIPKGWKVTTLGEVAKVIGGGTPKTDVPEYWGGKIPWLSVVDFNDDSRWVYKTEKTITNKGLENSSTSLLNTGDLIISARGTVGAFAQLKFPMAFNQSCYGLRAKENSENNFLYYLLKQSIQQIKRNVHGAVFDTITRDTFDQVVVEVPPLPEQRMIVAVLSSLDDKVELLREQNKTLEASAQAIFKEWFVNFNFPNATGKMIDSELGEIPVGWRVGKLGNEFDITIGRTPPRLETEWFSDKPTGKKWISIKDIGNSEMYISNTSEYLTDEAIEKFNIPIIPENTAILSFKMTVGKLAITTEEMLSNEAIAHLKVKENSNFSTEFIYLFLKGLDFNSLGSTSSIVIAINSTMIKALKVLVPKNQTMLKFNSVIQPIFAKLKNNNSQIQTLSTLRDTLLPKLMRGEVRVKKI